MKLIKILITGIVLTTVVSCSSLEINETPLAPVNAGVSSGGQRTPGSQPKTYNSVGIFSSGNKLKGDLLLENSLSDLLHKRKVRNLTSNLALPGTETRALAPVVKILKKGNFEALLVIKQLEISSESLRSPSSTVASDARESLVIQKEREPLRTLTAQIEFLDIKTKNMLWSGTLTYQDVKSLPLLIEKTAEGIVAHLSQKNLIP